MFFYFALIALIGGVVLSFANRNRTMPAIILVLGVSLAALTFMGVAGPLGLAGVALLAVIIWIANKADMT